MIELGLIDFRFGWLLLLLPLPLLMSYIKAAPQHEAGAVLLPNAELLTGSLFADALRSRFYRVLLGLIWILLVLAGAGPQRLGDLSAIPSTGRDLMMAVDVSGSMRRQDFEINGRQYDRLTVVKLVAGEFIKKRQGDRIGLILFGDHAYLQAPLTYDNTTVAKYLDESVIGIAGNQDTAIGDAIGLAIKQLLRQPADARVLVLLSDGANTSGAVQPREAAKLAAENNVKIYTIGMAGAVMKMGSGFFSRNVNPSRDLDERLLLDIAETTGGAYYRAHNLQELALIYQALDALEPSAGDDQKIRPISQYSHWPLMAAIALALLSLILRLLPGLWLRVRGVFSL